MPYGDVHEKTIGYIYGRSLCKSNPAAIKCRQLGVPTSAGAQWSCNLDPRVTVFGRLMRRAHLDDLSQLFNILRGEMSLICPRPGEARVHHQAFGGHTPPTTADILLDQA